MSNRISTELLEKTMLMLEEYSLCDYCLGRQFAWLGTDTTNQERGKAILSVLLMEAELSLKGEDTSTGLALVKLLAENAMYIPAQKIAARRSLEVNLEKTCHLCTIAGSSVFGRLGDIVQKMKEESQGVEYQTFLVGTTPDPELVDREDELRGKHSILYGESLKSQYNRELGKELSKIIEKQVEFERPDVVFVYDMKKDTVEIQINPVFIYGRYKKLVRGIPQSRWDCNDCHGKGCSQCGGTGRKYPDSISEYIGIPVQKLMKGSRFKVHAAGREDVDVLMLGTGRPFVLEISKPMIRTPDLGELERAINSEANGKIEVMNLELTVRERAQTIKSEASENVKEYLAQIQIEETVTEDELKKAEEKLTDIQIKQRTPTRVSHRRSDLIRDKQILQVKLTRISENLVEGFFKVQGGTYIKELISGDDGRTTPSLSSVLGRQCICNELNVIAIYGHSPHHNA